MYPRHSTTGYPGTSPRSVSPRSVSSGYGIETFGARDAPVVPQDIRPLITRHRLRRQRRRKAATLLTGASIALGVAALRPPNASAQSGKSPTPITHSERHAAQHPVLVHHSAPD